MKAILVITTVDSQQEAENIAAQLLKEGLAACVNITEPAKSFFWWHGKIDSAKEYMLLIKTSRKLFSRIVEAIKKSHSYETPEIIALPIVEASRDYLEWLNSSLLHGENDDEETSPST